MRRVITGIGDWFDRRLQLAAPIREAAEHPVPRNTASWFYVFGSAALTVFILQLVTGILLALIYVPSASEAWNSLQALNHDVTLGWFIRAMHGWGSNFMVALVLIHMVQVFLFGAYKFPRELTWIIGVFLLLMTLGMAFSGQVLRFDQDAYWGLGIGASIASRVPIAGPAIVKLMLGGPIIAGATLSRFFALHVFVIPGLLIGFVCLHLLMVLKLGINEWPMPGRLVSRATYTGEYHELTKSDGAPFVPYAVWKDLFFAAFILLAVAACALYFGPFGPTGRPDPTIIQTVPKPDYFFLWLYALLSLLPPSMETPALLIGPVVVIAVLVLLPFLSGEGEKSWRRRPIALLTVLLIAVTLGTFTHLAGYTPWSPHMNAWSGDPVPGKFLHHTTALQRQGALVFQVKQCRNCHSLGESGGQRGPALDSVAVRLTEDQLIRQVIQGGGNMPAYGKNLSPAETTALVAFLETLHPAGQTPARDAALSEAQEKRCLHTITAPMSPFAQSVWESWSIPVPLTLITSLAAFLYLRGWLLLRLASLSAIPSWRAASFFLGLFLIWAALGSPFAAFDEELLTIHMVQHLLLLTIAPPLILLGAPLMPLLHGLPRKFVRSDLGPVLRWPPIRRVCDVLSQPAFCWFGAAAALVGWHIPASFTLALHSEAWHVVEHASFLGSGFLFWWPVIQPWPSVTVSPRWWILLYLFLATVPCDILSAFLAFCDRVVYPDYLLVPRQFGISALADQQCAGALMWTCITFVYLVPAAILTIRLLAARSSVQEELPQSASHGIVSPQSNPRGLEVV